MPLTFADVDLGRLNDQPTALAQARGEKCGHLVARRSSEQGVRMSHENDAARWCFRSIEEHLDVADEAPPQHGRTDHEGARPMPRFFSSNELVGADLQRHAGALVARVEIGEAAAVSQASSHPWFQAQRLAIGFRSIEVGDGEAEVEHTFAMRFKEGALRAAAASHS